GIAQIGVCTVPDLGDWTKEEFAVDLFRKWGLGHGKKHADGLLVLLVPGKPGHRKIKVEVGYGLEGLLPDGKLGALIDQYAVPALRRNDYGDAAVKLVDAFAGVLEGNAGAGGELAPEAGGMRGGRGVGAARGRQGAAPQAADRLRRGRRPRRLGRRRWGRRRVQRRRRRRLGRRRREPRGLGFSASRSTPKLIGHVLASSAPAELGTTRGAF